MIVYGCGGCGDCVTGLTAEDDIVTFECVDRVRVAMRWGDGFNGTQDISGCIGVSAYIDADISIVASNHVIANVGLDRVGGVAANDNVVAGPCGDGVIVCCAFASVV